MPGERVGCRGGWRACRWGWMQSRYMRVVLCADNVCMQRCTHVCACTYAQDGDRVCAWGPYICRAGTCIRREAFDPRAAEYMHGQALPLHWPLSPQTVAWLCAFPEPGRGTRIPWTRPGSLPRCGLSSHYSRPRKSQCDGCGWAEQRGSTAGRGQRSHSGPRLNQPVASPYHRDRRVPLPVCPTVYRPPNEIASDISCRSCRSAHQQRRSRASPSRCVAKCGQRHG